MKVEQLPSGTYRVRIMIDGQGSKSLRFRDQIRDKLGSQKRKNNSICKNCFSEMRKESP